MLRARTLGGSAATPLSRNCFSSLAFNSPRIAAVGIYGVTAYTVLQRPGEFGIRMAMGAQRGDVLRLVLRDGGKLICAGLLLGVGTTLAGSRLVGSMLFQTSSRDPLTLGAVTLLLGAVALVACLIPALRAIKVSPMEALRAD